MRVGRPKKPAAHLFRGSSPEPADSAIRASAAAFRCTCAPRHALLQWVLCVIAGVPDSGGARRKLLPGVRFLQSLGQRICGRMEWLPFGYFSIVSIQTCGAAFCAGSSDPVRFSDRSVGCRCLISRHNAFYHRSVAPRKRPRGCCWISAHCVVRMRLRR